MSAITRRELKLTILLVCTFCLITADVVVVRGYAGGGVLIKCKYNSKLESITEYFCKGYDKCEDQIRAGDQPRFSLLDDVNSTAFSVMIKELSKKDSGNYMCKTDKHVVTDKYTQVNLTVEEGQSYMKFNKTARVGEDMNITCKFPEQHRSHPKFFCKRSHTGGCVYKLVVKESRKFLQEGRIVLYDDRAKQIFNVTLKNVTKGHSGEYWCGAEVDWDKDHGYKVYITQVNLRVSDVHDLNVLPPTSTTKGTRTIARTKSRKRDSSHGTSAEFPVSTVVTVSVLLVLFAVGTSFLIVILQKRKKKKASVHTHSVPGSGNNHEVSPAVCDYEEIDHSSRVAPSASDPSALYSTPRPLTNLSDPPVYANAGFPTTPCDSSNTIYATAQLPINKQKFPEQDFSRPATSNSHAQQSVQKPAVGPVYASVSFHRSNSNGAGPKVIFKRGHIM